MSNIIPFKFHSHQVRTIITDSGDPVWVAKDVAEALGYANPSEAVKYHCKGVAKRYPLQTAGGMQEVRVLHEPDLYRLIASSNLPAAQEFEKLIFEEILPTIRKTGSYSAPKSTPLPESIVPISKEFRAAVSMAKAAGLKGNMAVLSANQLITKSTGTDCLMLLDITHLIAEKQVRYYNPTELGQQLDPPLTAQKFNELLANMGLQSKTGGKWAPTEAGERYAVLMDVGKRHGSGTPVQQLKWTADVLRAVGI